MAKRNPDYELETEVNPNSDQNRLVFWSTCFFSPNLTDEQIYERWQEVIVPALAQWCDPAVQFETPRTHKKCLCVQLHSQLEKCNERPQRAHAHIYAKFVDPGGSGPSGISMKNRLKELFGCPAHFMIPKCRDSTVYEKYTSKLETRFPGEPSSIHINNAQKESHKEAEDADWIAEFNQGATPIQVATKFTKSQRHYRAMKDLYEDFIAQQEAPPATGDFVVKVFAGKSGTGKSSSVSGYAEFLKRTLKEPYFVISSLNVSSSGVVWWDGYRGEHIIIIEEFENWITFNQLKVILDANHCDIQQKGSRNVRKNWNRVYITTNMEFGDWYRDRIEKEANYRTPSLNTYNQLWRRIHNYYELGFALDQDGNPTTEMRCTEHPLPYRDMIVPRIDEVLKLQDNCKRCPTLLRALCHTEEEYEIADRALRVVNTEFVDENSEERFNEDQSDFIPDLDNIDE